LSFAYANRPVVEAVTLDLPAGSFLALLGASGSGKTTLLKLIGGYLSPSAGRVVLAGRDVTALPPERRRVGMVFQSYALFPHQSARGNVAFGLEVRGVARAERRRRVEEALDRVALDPAARDRRPTGLSGGQQQRVALARALVIEPELLLLDEPLANLDRRLREQVRGELRALQRRTGVTTLLVTHDQEEALALADVLGVMAAGRLLQSGTPRAVYERPVCPYVARLLGDANLLEVERVEGGAVTLTGGWRIASRQGCLAQATEGDVVLVRPERVSVNEGGSGSPARVQDVSYRGSQALVELLVAQTRLVASVPPQRQFHPGQEVTVHVPDDGAYLLPESDPPGLTA
jgi:ABC-type Fe3+/spermidine/putrescine transport system ATPase subunit